MSFRPRRILPVLSLATLVLGMGLARPASAVDKFGAEFLKLGVGSRALGMGGSFVAVADDASAGYWNPAGLTFLTATDLQITHAEVFGGILKHDVASWGMPIGGEDSRSTIGVTLIRLSVDDIKVTRDALIEESGGLVRLDPSKVRIASAYDLGLMFSYARGIGDAWSLGGNFKMIRQSLVDEGSSFGLGADLGLMFHPSPATTFGLRLADVTTTQISWDTGRHETLAPTATLGAQTTRDISALKGTLTAGVDLQMAFEDLGEADQFSSGSLSGNVLPGLEYWYNRTVALRLGSNAGHFAAGAGLRFKLGPLQRFGVDYAFVDHDELDATNRVTLNLGW
jgi:hypothetical protein